MNNIQLSICIPTYNREKYLKELLDCILNQLKDIEDDVVEICVSDNSSTDNTQSMILEYQQKYNNITYFRWDKNMGADMNYLKVVEIAHGKYCWFFGSDDLMADGAIKKMLEEIKEKCDIYLCNRYECDINMNVFGKTDFFYKNIPSKIFKFSDTVSRIKYLKCVKGLGGVFSYLSAIVFKKEQWDSIKYDTSFTGTAYAHSYILLSIINKNNTTFKISDEYLVMNRNENDSFLINGYVNRIKLDFDGYKKLFTVVFKDNKKIADYYKVILKYQYSYYILSSIYEKFNIDDKKILLSFIKETHCVFFIVIISLCFRVYRLFFKKILKKLNVHKKITDYLP